MLTAMMLVRHHRVNSSVNKRVARYNLTYARLVDPVQQGGLFRSDSEIAMARALLTTCAVRAATRKGL